MPMHQLTIDPKCCRGIALCHACEAIKPGLVDYCTKHGRLLISFANTARYSSMLSRLAQVCPDRAIMIKPMEHRKP